MSPTDAPRDQTLIDNPLLEGLTDGTRSTAGRANLDDAVKPLTARRTGASGL